MPLHEHVKDCIQFKRPIADGGCGSCPHCTLCVCAICGCYEGSLTTDCPGEPVHFDKQEEIYKTGLDFSDEKGWHMRPDKDKGWPEAHFKKEPVNLSVHEVLVSKTIKMNIYGRDRSSLAELEWRDGQTKIVRCVDGLDEFFKRTIEFGLNEMVGPLDDPSPRHTAPSDLVFLERVGSYLKRQSGFIVSLRELETLPRG